MTNKICFILNNENIKTDLHAGTILLDFIRYNKKLKGTKIGCREGDCGTCTVLVGELIDEELQYKSIVSCLTPLGNVHGKHVVTIEGINSSTLTFIQKELADAGGTQCGFCTPGFIVSLTGHCLNSKDDVLDSISGNICRCTGYKSIEKAAFIILRDFQKLDDGDALKTSIQMGTIPEYFDSIKPRLAMIHDVSLKHNSESPFTIISGGTDLYVQQAQKMVSSNLQFLQFNKSLKFIRHINDDYELGASNTISDLEYSDIIQKINLQLTKFFRLFASRLIKNTATIGGNIVNASPIGDSIILFLALNAYLRMTKNGITREVALNKFYLGYKEIDLQENEIIEAIVFTKPPGLFNFEKVSKRTNLDIASVNSAISINLKNDTIEAAHLSAGGIAPIPMYLERTVEYLIGKELSPKIITEAAKIAQSEVSPISDIRGSKEYKLLLLRQLIYGHFIELFPDKIKLEELV